MLREATKPDDIKWTIELLLDLVYSNALTADACSVRALEGKLQNSGGKGLVDRLIYKRDIATSIHRFLESKERCPDDKKDAIRHAFSDIKTFRQHAGYYYNPDYKIVNLTWRAGMPPSMEKTFKLFEDTGLRNDGPAM